MPATRPPRPAAALASALALALAACAPAVEDTDAARDAGDVADALATDALADDAGGMDAALPPADARDAAPTDAVSIDAAPDGGIDARPDALPMDAPPADAPPRCVANGLPGECIPTTSCTGARMSTPGFCPGPANIQCCTARVDGGGADAGADGGRCTASDMPQPNTNFVEEPGAGGCPAGMTRVDAFCIDRYEAMLALVAPDGTLSPWSPYFNPGTRRVRALSIRGAVPQGYISGVQAAAACREAGKRLCADAEWLRACRGVALNTYPYGPSRMPGVCNDSRSRHPAVEYFGSSEPWVYSMLDHPCINQLPDSLDRAGANTGCVTPDGVYDLMGNLHEWTADPAGTFRGGFYADTRINGEGCLYRTTAHDTRHADYSTGFRCCATP